VSGLIGSVEHVSVTLPIVDISMPANAMVLLVGPSGTNVILMAGAGATNGNANLVRLVFSDMASNALPQNSQIFSGNYRPTNFAPTNVLPAPAPPLGYGADFSVFKGTDPNGYWLLYVYDNGSATGGTIANGWELNIRTAPRIPKIKDQFTPENVAARVTITVGDDQPEFFPLTVTATGSADLFKLPIEVSGSGAIRTLTIVPQPYQSGTNTITVTAVDDEGVTATAEFQMGVQFVPQPPLFISVPPDQFGCLDDLDPILFSVWSPQGSPLSITAYSADNPAMLPSIEVTQMAETNNGTNHYWLSPNVSGVLVGTATILILASDTNGLKSIASFKLTVPTDCGFPTANNSISIPLGATNNVLEGGEATPYPSVISVVGLDGIVKSVKVILIGLTHPHPEDVKVLLVSPDNSRATMLMAHAGEGGPASSLRLTFIDGARAVPHYGQLTDNTYYGPADYSTGANLPLPAPPGPYSTNLSVFNGVSPNGDWKLYVLDDTYPTGGSIDGWLLRVQLNYPPTLFMQPQGSGLVVSFTGPTNTVYGIQSSGDLVTWTNAGKVTTGSDGRGKFDVQIDPVERARLYRVVGQ
jgi:subtilisin-like proprotein convertase family protein